MTLGQRLEKLRLERDRDLWTQTYVAERIGAAQSQVSRWESCESLGAPKKGDRNVPDPHNLVKLSELYGVRLRYLITGDYPRTEGLEEELAAFIDGLATALDEFRGLTPHDVSQAGDDALRAIEGEAIRRGLDARGPEDRQNSGTAPARRKQGRGK